MTAYYTFFEFSKLMAISLDTRQIFALLPNAEQNIKTVTPVAVIQKSPEIQTFILISF